MYKDDVAVIAEAMRSNLDVFERGVMFAVLSARQPFMRVRDQMEGLEKDGENYGGLFSWKLNAYLWLKDNSATLWQALRTTSDPYYAMIEVTRMPGLGLVKGGFVLQLMGFDVACLDARNVRTEGRDAREFRSDGPKGKTGASWYNKVNRYLEETGGKAEYYWNAWCQEYADQVGMTADMISKRHLDIVPVGLRRKGRTTVPITAPEFAQGPTAKGDECPF